MPELIERQKAFLRKYQELGTSWPEAAEAIGIMPTTIDKWMRTDSAFLENMQAIDRILAARVIGDVRRDAKEGHATSRIFLIKAQFPEYKERYVSPTKRKATLKDKVRE